jgi:hypothetical protein
MVNEVTAPTRKDKMASRTAATGLGIGGPSGPHEQPGIRQTDRRESWIPYPTLPDSGETEGTMDYADFTRLCQEDVDALFNMVNEAYASLEAANRTITALKGQNSDLEDENRRLKDQVSQRDEQADDLIDERDRLQRTVINLATQVGSTPSREASAALPEKSVKLPNPPVLTDGKDPEFEDWESRIRNKLRANADHYDTEALRIAYVENRVGGKAAKHLRPRLRASAINPYTTAEEMLKHLETIFQDANREANAKREFRKLNMRATDKFQDFLTNFLHLAGEAQIPAVMYKDELYQRITWKLQEMTIKESMDNDIDFDAYNAVCTKLADHLSVINESRNQVRQGSRSNAFPPGNTGASTSRTETRKREGTPTSGTAFTSRTKAESLPPEKRELFQSGKCFYCRLSGHIAMNCPRKKKEGTLKGIELKEENEVEPLNSQP